MRTRTDLRGSEPLSPALPLKGEGAVLLPPLVQIRDLPSPNQDDRPDGVPIDTLILHYTGMQTAQAAIDRLRDPAAQVSSHYVVDEDGTVLRLVPEARRAYHAGVSYWRGNTDAERPLDRHRDRQSRP